MPSPDDELAPSAASWEVRDLAGCAAFYVIGQTMIALLGAVAPAAVRTVEGGPLLSPDSQRYLAAAQELSHLRVEDASTLGYVLVLALGDLLGSAARFALVVQALALVAAGAAMITIGRLYHRPLTGWFAAATLLMNPLLAQWSRFVLTEPLFYAGLVGTLAAMLTAYSRTEPGWAPLWVIALATATIRPNAIVVPAAVATFVLVWRRPRWWVLAVAGVWCVIGVIGIFSPTHASGGGGAANTLAARTYAGEVIWGLPELRLDMPASEDTTDVRGEAFVSYAADHPLPVVGLGLRRTAWELVQIRPHYPASVNVLVGLGMFAFYLFALVGRQRLAATEIDGAVACLALPLLGTIFLTWATPEGRFGWAVLLLLIPWVAAGMSDTFGRLARTARSPTG